MIELNDDYKKDLFGKYILNKNQIDDLVKKMVDKKIEINSKIRLVEFKGNSIVVVDYGHILDLDKLSMNTQRKLIAIFIKAIFHSFQIFTVDKILVTTSHTGLRKLTNAVKEKDFGILLFSDSLVQTASFNHTKPDSKGRKMQYRYYDAYLSLDASSVFSMQLNIRVDHMGAVIYDINKIKKSGWTIRLGKPVTL